MLIPVMLFMANVLLQAVEEKSCLAIGNCVATLSAYSLFEYRYCQIIVAVEELYVLTISVLVYKNLQHVLTAKPWATVRSASGQNESNMSPTRRLVS